MQTAVPSNPYVPGGQKRHRPFRSPLDFVPKNLSLSDVSDMQAHFPWNPTSKGGHLRHFVERPPSLTSLKLQKMQVFRTGLYRWVLGHLSQYTPSSTLQKKLSQGISGGAISLKVSGGQTGGLQTTLRPRLSFTRVVPGGHSVLGDTQSLKSSISSVEGENDLHEVPIRPFRQRRHFACPRCG